MEIPHNAHPNDDWRHQAACKGEDPELFFPVSDVGPSIEQIERAKSFCQNCPVLNECLREALEAGLDFGIWGGTTEQERRVLKNKGHVAEIGELALREV